MYDRELVSEVLNQIKHSADLVLRRFEPINAVSDFTDSEAGMEKLDAICMQLIAIGEGLKNIDKITDNSLLPRYSQVNIQIMRAFTRLRQLLSTHEELKKKIEAMEEKYDENFKIVFEAIKQLIEVEDKPKKKRIGYTVKEKQAAYGRRPKKS